MDRGDLVADARALAGRWLSLKDLTRVLGAPGLAVLDSCLVVVPRSPERWSVLDSVRRVTALAEDLLGFAAKHGVRTWAELDDMVRKHAGVEGASFMHHAELRFVGLELLAKSTESLLFEPDAGAVDDLGGLLVEASDGVRGSLREFVTRTAEDLRRIVVFSVAHARPLLCEKDPRAARFARWGAVCF